MRRREFITLLGSAAAWPLVARAQQTPKMPRIGYLMDRSGPGLFDEGFLLGLRERGYDVGQNIRIEYRWTEGKTEQLPALAGELVALKVDVIVTAGAQAVKEKRRPRPFQS
jgi:putative ABC transport system substrate-binding protein